MQIEMPLQEHRYQAPYFLNLPLMFYGHVLLAILQHCIHLAQD